MKTILIGTIFVFVSLNQMIHSQDQWSNVWESLEGGERQFGESGDKLLFRDNRTSKWSFGISNMLSLEYTNVNITWWKVDLSPVSV